MDAEFSILNPGTKEFEPLEVAAYFQDLNLYQIIEKLSAKWGKRVRNYYRYLPGTAADVAYRQAVYADVKKESVYSTLLKYTQAMEEVDRLRREKEKVSISIQRVVWHLREVGAYCKVYEELAKDLETAEPASEGLREFLRILKEILESGGYRELEERTEKLLEQIRRIRFTITYDKDRMSVALGTAEESSDYGDRFKKELKNPFIADPSLTEMENACLEILAKKKPEFFEELKATAKLNEEYEKSVLKRFEREVIFYLSFRALQLDMEKQGYKFATPAVSGDHKMEAKGLYDLALALVNLNTGKEVVPNDFHYEEGEQFFVLTGPNQGGKTTFARSLGQLVYFTRIGLDVPAEAAVVPFFPDIQTHFSVEESVETGRGKLKEELVRLAPMMEDDRKGSFVIINELFTTAASYDANIMGRKVLEHFTKLECMGIYVTHLQELVEGQKAVVSLRAMLDDRRIQTFKITRGEADDTACADNLVNKYRLNYEQLKERL